MKQLFSFFFVFTMTTFAFSSCLFNKVDSACYDSVKRQQNQGNYCTMQYDPVCGCDNMTYSNSCEAEKAGLRSYNLGECPR